jgi:hypothetical protein
VESCKWHGGSSICDICECGEVQDEKHVLFFCKCAEVCELRMRYRNLFEGMFKTLHAFAPSSSEFIPFLACHQGITDFEINAFLNQDSYRLLKFVSDLVSIFDFVSPANCHQPESRAVGHPCNPLFGGEDEASGEREGTTMHEGESLRITKQFEKVVLKNTVLFRCC